MKKFIQIYLIQIKNNWVREAVYRTNFITALFVDFAWVVVELSLFAVIYANVTTLAGWTQDQVFFFLGIFFASDALFTIFFNRNFFVFSDLVNRGDLDIFLIKPAPTLFLILTRWINVSAVFNFTLGLIILYRYATPAGFEGGTKWLLVFFWLLLGVTTAVLLRFAFAVWIFWTDRNWALLRIYYQFFAFATKPDALYPKFIRYLILTILPFAFIGSVPARALLHGLENWEYLMIVVVLSCLLVIDALLWRLGLRRYQSASS